MLVMVVAALLSIQWEIGNGGGSTDCVMREEVMGVALVIVHKAKADKEYNGMKKYTRVST